MSQPDALYLRIWELANKHGSFRAAARVLKVDHAYLARLRDGTKKEPGVALLKRMGLERVITYKKIKEPKE